MAKSYDIQAIISKITLEQVLIEFGIPYRYNRGKIEFLCQKPDHNDQHFGNCMNQKRNPNKWICFGCDSKGDIIDLTEYHFGVDKKEALKILSERFNIPETDDEATAVANRPKLTEAEYTKLSCETKTVRTAGKILELSLYEINTKQAIRMRDLYEEDPVLHDKLLIEGYFKSIKYYCQASLLLPEKIRTQALIESIKELKKILKKGLYDKSLYDNVVEIDQKKKSKKTPAA